MLNFNSGSNSSSSGYVRYMASTASWQTEGETLQMKQAVYDLKTIKTGWMRIQLGEAPEFIADPSLEQSASKPDGEDWKRGFKVNIFSKAMFGDDAVKEWGTNSTGACMGMQQLYSDYEEANKGDQLPVVSFEGGNPTKIGKGSTNVPIFKIVKWIDTPDELQEKSVAASPPAPEPSDDLGDEF